MVLDSEGSKWKEDRAYGEEPIYVLSEPGGQKRPKEGGIIHNRNAKQNIEKSSCSKKYWNRDQIGN